MRAIRAEPFTVGLLAILLTVKWAWSQEYKAYFKMADNTDALFTIGNILKEATPQYPLATYQIIIRQCSYSKFNRYFRITDAGRLYLVYPFDRDDINNVCGPLGCCEKSKCTIILDLKVTHVSSGMAFSQEVTIDIEDENDNSPKFLDLSFDVIIPENEKVFNSHRLPYAVDADSPNFDISKYRLEGPDFHYFTITNDFSRQKHPMLKANKVFDFENPNERVFNLFLIAEDKGGKYAKLPLSVSIADANDNKPKFNTNIVNLTLMENTTYPQPIFVLEARDLDSGKNGKISYYFSSTTLPYVRGIFNLSPDTGELFLSKKLDYEMYMERKFVLSVEATDHGVPAFMDYCNININVTDINDNSPVIDLTYQQDIPENEQVVKEVMKIYVRDDDSIDSTVTCRSDSANNQLEIKKMEGQTYFIYATGVYDYEKNQNISLDITCSDDALEPKSIKQRLTINIIDKNDNLPIFDKESYRVKIAESHSINKTFLKIRATDADSGKFGKLIYYIEDQMKTIFKIIEETGDLMLKESLDREKAEHYSIHVFAKDGGGLIGKTIVSITVLDSNDNAPRLKSSPNMSVVENCPIGQVVGIVEVEDLDLNNNGRVNWNVDLAGNASKYLELQDNKTVITKTPIDREMVDKLYFIVNMNDYGDPMMASSATVTVLIEDQNDNIPIVEYPTQGAVIDKLNSVILAINTPKLTPLLTLTSYDPDYGINGQVLYHLLPSNGTGFFEVNQTTGELLSSWDYDSLSFTPTYPKEGVYKISYAAYNQVKSSTNSSSSVTSHFYLRIGSYHHSNNNDDQFYLRHKRPFFNNVVLLILIGGFTISLSAALIAAIVWAKSKFSSESNNLEQVQNNDGKFVMMMMGPNEIQHQQQQHQQQLSQMQLGNSSYLYDPTYVSLMADNDRTIDSGYPLTHSHSSTFNSRHGNRDHYLLNNYDAKTMPRSVLPAEMVHHYTINQQHQLQQQQQQQQHLQPHQYQQIGSTSSTNESLLGARAASVSGQQRNIPSHLPQHHKPVNSFYRTFEDDPQCRTTDSDNPASPSPHRLLNKNRSVERPYATIPARVASICDPTPTAIISTNESSAHLVSSPITSATNPLLDNIINSPNNSINNNNILNMNNNNNNSQWSQAERYTRHGSQDNGSSNGGYAVC